MNPWNVMTLRIHKATIDDIESITRNNILLAKESEQITLVYSTVFEGVNAVIKDPTKGFYLVAKQNNIIVGQLLVTYEWSDWKNEMIWWIQSVFIQKNLRKQGIFTLLLKKIFSLAQKEDIKRFRLYVHHNNTEARTTYAHMRMKKTSYTLYEFTQHLLNNMREE